MYCLIRGMTKTKLEADKADDFFIDYDAHKRLKKSINRLRWINNLKPSLLEIPNFFIMLDVYTTSLKSLTKAKIKHAYNLLTGKYYF